MFLDLEGCFKRPTEREVSLVDLNHGSRHAERRLQRSETKSCVPRVVKDGRWPPGTSRGSLVKPCFPWIQGTNLSHQTASLENHHLQKHQNGRGDVSFLRRKNIFSAALFFQKGLLFESSIFCSSKQPFQKPKIPTFSWISLGLLSQLNQNRRLDQT